MLQFILAGEDAQAAVAERPGSLGRLRGRAVALSSDLLKSAWTEAMRVGDRAHDDVRPRITQGTPRWKGNASMTLEDARLASLSDGRGSDDSLSGSLGGDAMPVSGSLEVFDDHLVMNVFVSGPLEPFAIRPKGAIEVVGVVPGNPGDAAFVMSLSSGHRIVLRLGRARRLADVLGTLPPG